MNQPEALQVSQGRVQDILKGKAASTIGDLMVENAQLTAALEALQQKVVSLQDQLSRASTPAPSPGPPQDASV